MTQGGRTGRRRTLGGLVLAVVLGLSACSGPQQSADPASGSVPPGTSVSAAVAPSAVTGGPTTPDPVTTEPPATTADTPVGTTTTASPTSPDVPAPLTLPDASPVSLSVPAIGVNSPLSSLGRNPDGTVEVPSLDDPNAGAGWFRDSPEPGSLGPSIILGHVDSREYGPGVFFDLKNLATGDTIEITRSDGTVAVFTVDSVQDVPKAQFPTQQVYGNIDHAGLRLITCGGVFDSEVRSYEDNIIAFATLTSSHPA